MRTATFYPALFCLVVSGCGSGTTEPHGTHPPVAVYAAHEAGNMQAVATAFTAESGITIVLETESGAALIERLSAEKHRATADLVLADGVAYLWAAAESDLLRPSHSAVLGANIPEIFHDSENRWFGMLGFVWTVAYDTRIIDPAELVGYAELGDERWRGRLCLSSARNAGNQALVAMLIAEHGNRPAELIVRSWIENLAKPAVADDATLLADIEAGRCGLGIVNSDDALRLTGSRPDTAVGLFWPDDAAGGVYIDAIAAGVARHAANPDGALQFLEWLSSERGQIILEAQNPGYRVDRELPVDHINPIDLDRAAFYREDAVLLMERAGY